MTSASRGHRQVSPATSLGMSMLCGVLLAACCVGASAGPTVSESEAAFLARCAELGSGAEAAGKLVVPGREGWLFLAPELQHLGAGKFWGPESASASSSPRKDARDPLPAILDFHRQLKALGMELLLVPIPPRAVIYADKLPGRDGSAVPVRRDPWHRAFYGLLRDKGVPVLDVTDAFLAARRDEATRGFVCCMQDTHCAPRGCEILAAEIHRTLSGRIWAKARATYISQAARVNIIGDLWSMLGQEEGARALTESVALHYVGVGSGVPPVPVMAESASPALLLGDSHGLVFHSGGEMMHARGAGIADHLALHFGFPWDEICRRGSASTSVRVDLARKFYRDAPYREGKKVIVWCFAAREFTGVGGWRVLRISR